MINQEEKARIVLKHIDESLDIIEENIQKIKTMPRIKIREINELSNATRLLTEQLNSQKDAIKLVDSFPGTSDVTKQLKVLYSMRLQSLTMSAQMLNK